jgi:hypothetical protein
LKKTIDILTARVDRTLALKKTIDILTARVDRTLALYKMVDIPSSRADNIRPYRPHVAAREAL